MGARQDILDLVKASGWELNTAATIPASRYGRERKQDPHAFVRPAKHGGQWEITLNFRNGASYYHGYDDRLRGVNVEHRGEDGEYSRLQLGGNYKGDLRTPGKYDSHNGLYSALGPGTLRQRAEKLIKDPDLAIWLGMESRHRHDTAQRAKWAAEAAHYDAKAQPNPAIALDGGKWRSVGYKLQAPAKALAEAHGLTDVVAELAKAQRAIDALYAGLTDEAREHYDAELLTEQE